MRISRKSLLLGGLVLAAAVPLPGLAEAVVVSAETEFDEAPSSTREYATIARHLRRSFCGYGKLDVLAPQFAIVALSHMASGLLNVYVAEPNKQSEVYAHVREVRRRALTGLVSPFGIATDASARMDDHNLFWSHLALILGVERYMRCTGRACPADDVMDPLHERIVTHLRSRSLATGLFHAPSYPGSPMWPADQTVSLLAMKLYDATRGTSLHREPLRGFLRVMQDRRDPQTGLFPSSVSPIKNADVPRGCAASWVAAYLVHLDPAAAFDQYSRARTWLREDILGLGGFREWPVRRGGGADIDSGPIVFGIGIAATGLGLAPARIFGDHASYTSIRRSALCFGLPAWWKSGGHWAAPLLGEAILFHGRTARTWFGVAPAVAPRPVPAPLAPAIMATFDATVLVVLALALVRRLKAAFLLSAR